MVKAVLLDIDGTLTRDRDTEALEPEAIAAIQDIVGRYVVGLVTGNALVVTQALARYIGLPRGGSPLLPRMVVSWIIMGGRSVNYAKT